MKQLQNTLKQLKSNIRGLYSCNFVKIIKMPCKNFFRVASVILTLLKYESEFIVHLSPTFLTFQRVTKLIKFGIVGK